jgi:hypothetical protein
VHKFQQINQLNLTIGNKSEVKQIQIGEYNVRREVVLHREGQADLDLRGGRKISKSDYTAAGTARWAAIGDGTS